MLFYSFISLLTHGLRTK